jgi:uncharacterized protein (DUF1499 family)
MQPCSDKPNCACSRATDPRHAIQPLRHGGAPAAVAWAAAERALQRLPRTTIVGRNAAPPRLHAESRTRIFRWVDDVELEQDAERGVIEIRSASRVGHSDFGTNRRRLEALRRLYEEELGQAVS